MQRNDKILQNQKELENSARTRKVMTNEQINERNKGTIKGKKSEKERMKEQTKEWKKDRRKERNGKERTCQL